MGNKGEGKLKQAIRWDPEDDRKRKIENRISARILNIANSSVCGVLRFHPRDVGGFFSWKFQLGLFSGVVVYLGWLIDLIDWFDWFIWISLFGLVYLE